MRGTLATAIPGLNRREKRLEFAGVFYCLQVSTGKAVVPLLVFGAIAAVAWQFGRATERKARLEGGVVSPRYARGRPVEASARRSCAPRSASRAEPRRSTSVRFPTPPAKLPPPPRSPSCGGRGAAEDPSLRYAGALRQAPAYPSNVSAYGSSARSSSSSCARKTAAARIRPARGSALSRSHRTGRSSRPPLGRFPAESARRASAETLIALRTKPAMGLMYRAEIQLMGSGLHLTLFRTGNFRFRARATFRPTRIHPEYTLRGPRCRRDERKHFCARPARGVSRRGDPLVGRGAGALDVELRPRHHELHTLR